MASCLNNMFLSNSKPLIMFIPNALDLIYLRRDGRYRDGRGYGWGNKERFEYTRPLRNLRDSKRIDIPHFGRKLLQCVHFKI